MKKSTKITAVIVLALGIATTGGAYAGKKMSEQHEKKAAMAVSFIAYKLDLDTTQQQALSALKDQVLTARSTMHEQMGSTQDDVRELVAAETFDQAKALNMLNTKTATVDTLAPELVGALGNFLDSLDAEQKAEILDFMESHHGKRGRGRWGH